MTNRNVVVVGLGYVGLATLLVAEAKGSKVMGVEKDPERLARLRQGAVAIHEPGMQEALVAGLGRGTIRLVDRLGDEVAGSIIFIAVGTPPNSTGAPDLTWVDEVGRELAGVVNSSTVVVFKSTVPPDICAHFNGVVQSERSHLNLPPVKFGLVTYPEFLQEGSALSDAMSPNRIVIGATEESLARLVLSVFGPVSCPVVLTDPVSAMLTKYASNAFLAIKVAFINEMAAMCEALGANIDDVAVGVGADPRIGPAFLKTGPGYGGSCLPKDTAALVRIGRAKGCSPQIVEAVISANEVQFERVFGKVLARLEGVAEPRVCVLGLAFKAGTNDIRDSLGLRLCLRLKERGVSVCAHDYMAGGGNLGIDVFKEPVAALEDSDVAVLMTEWPQYRDLNWGVLKTRMRHARLVDARNLLSPIEARQAGLEYWSIGRPEGLDVRRHVGGEPQGQNAKVVAN
jgi:UDPglucose 6-dehydrogenase